MPCQSRFSLNNKCVCFSNAVKAHSNTVCAPTRPGDHRPIAHVTARFCLLSRIHLQQADATVREKDVERDLSHPTRRNISIYLLHLPGQGKRHRGWKSYNDFRPAPPEAATPLLGHTMTLSSRALSEIGTFASTPLMAWCRLHGAPAAPSAAPAGSPRAEATEMMRRNSFPFSTSHAASVLRPSSAHAQWMSFLPTWLYLTATRESFT